MITLVQVVLLDQDGEALTTDQTISVTSVRSNTLLVGLATAKYIGVDRRALFTDLAIMQSAEDVQLRFMCDSCRDSGEAMLDISATWETFNVSPELQELSFEWLDKSNTSFEYPNVAGEVSSLLLTALCPSSEPVRGECCY